MTRMNDLTLGDCFLQAQRFPGTAHTANYNTLYYYIMMIHYDIINVSFVSVNASVYQK